MNKVIIAGNLTRDPELRQTKSGEDACSMSLAMNESWRSADGEKQDRTTYVDVTVFGRQAGPCAQYLSKGAPALVEGSLLLEQWQTKDGDKRSKLSVKAQRVQFLGGGRREERPAQEQRPAQHHDDPFPHLDNEENLPF
jgi:single-strand DNA-binding protein